MNVTSRPLRIGPDDATPVERIGNDNPYRTTVMTANTRTTTTVSPVITASSVHVQTIVVTALPRRSSRLTTSTKTGYPWNNRFIINCRSLDVNIVRKDDDHHWAINFRHCAVNLNAKWSEKYLHANSGSGKISFSISEDWEYEIELSK